MKKLTEGEIQSLVRKYLIKNRFRLVSRTLDGQPLHYRVEVTSPPEFKIPDLVAVKANKVLVFEEKIRYSDLFKKEGSDGISDVEKLVFFLKNKQARSEFKKLVTNTGLSVKNPSVVGAFASLKPVSSDVDAIPPNFVFIAIEISSSGFSVELCQDGKLPYLFEIDTCEFTL